MFLFYRAFKHLYFSVAAKIKKSQTALNSVQFGHKVKCFRVEKQMSF